MTKEKNLELLRSKFLKNFAAVPLNLRSEIVAIVDEQPVNWAVAYIEVIGKTKKGDEILTLMDELNLLGD